MRNLQIEFESAYDAWHAASLAADDVRKSRTANQIELRRTENKIYADLAAVRASLRKEFARSRGWRESKRGFSIARLNDRARGRGAANLWHPEIDHPDCFDVNGAPAGIVTHSYSDWSALLAFARRHNLRAEPLPFSWYSPLTTAVLLTAPPSG